MQRIYGPKIKPPKFGPLPIFILFLTDISTVVRSDWSRSTIVGWYKRKLLAMVQKITTSLVHKGYAPHYNFFGLMCMKSIKVPNYNRRSHSLQTNCNVECVVEIIQTHDLSQIARHISLCIIFNPLLIFLLLSRSHNTIVDCILPVMARGFFGNNS